MAFIDKAKKIIKENSELFEALEEYDRTRKLRKASYKQRVNFTIDEKVFAKFKHYCMENGIKMSSKVELMIKEFIERVI